MHWTEFRKSAIGNIWNLGKCRVQGDSEGEPANCKGVSSPSEEIMEFKADERAFENARVRILQDLERMVILHLYGKLGAMEAFTPNPQQGVCALCLFGEVCVEGKAIFIPCLRPTCESSKAERISRIQVTRRRKHLVTDEVKERGSVRIFSVLANNWVPDLCRVSVTSRRLSRVPLRALRVDDENATMVIGDLLSEHCELRFSGSSGGVIVAPLLERAWLAHLPVSTGLWRIDSPRKWLEKAPFLHRERNRRISQVRDIRVASGRRRCCD